MILSKEEDWEKIMSEILIIEQSNLTGHFFGFPSESFCDQNSFHVEMDMEQEKNFPKPC